VSKNVLCICQQSRFLAGQSSRGYRGPKHVPNGYNTVYSKIKYMHGDKGGLGGAGVSGVA
jgi:hypothetical protein